MCRNDRAKLRWVFILFPNECCEVHKIWVRNVWSIRICITFSWNSVLQHVFERKRSKNPFKICMLHKLLRSLAQSDICIQTQFIDGNQGYILYIVNWCCSWNSRSCIFLASNYGPLCKDYTQQYWSFVLCIFNRDFEFQ